MGTTPDQTPIETLFARYRETGRPELLSAVFDRVAPELLRLGVHLVHDTAEAEDLVQATFLAAIERAADYDPRRPLAAWLTGILTRKALATHRRRRRAPDGGRVSARPEPRTPLELAELGELEGELERALDALSEPYRRPLILRLLHGLEPAAIAHVLDRPPGTVRVQLHRGLELLKKSLPGGLVASIALFVDPARGLAAVREAVLTEAGKLSVGVTAAAVSGGVLVLKKLLVVAAAAVLLLGITWLARGPGREPASPEGEPISAAALAPVEEGPATPVREPSPPTEQVVEPVDVSRSSVEGSIAVTGIALRGRVVDGRNGAPLADVGVELFPSSTATLADLHERFGHLLEQRLDGGVATWFGSLAIPPSLSPAELLGAPFRVHVPPASGAESLERTRTGAGGGFELGLPEHGGVLRLRHPEYGERVLAVPDTSQQDVVVELWPAARLAGRVVDPDGQPLTRPVTLHLDDCSLEPPMGSWSVRTDADGRFAASLPSPRVRAWARTVQPGADGAPGHEELWLFRGELIPGAAGDRVLRPMRISEPVLHVTDARTGAPIESVRVLSTGRHDIVRHCGRFHARDGWLYLYGGPNPLQRVLGLRSLRQTDQRVDLTVWADGYAPVTVALDLLATSTGEDGARAARGGSGARAPRMLAPTAVGVKPGPDARVLRDRPSVGHGLVREVRLEPGGVARVHGRVVAGRRAVVGADVELLAFRELAWRPEDGRHLDLGVTDAAGTFELAAPAGDYLLRVVADGEPWTRRVSVPTEEPIVVDLDRFARLVVTVEDRMARRLAEHAVMAIAADGRQVSGFTDERGEVAFDRLPPGALALHWPYRSTRSSWGPDESRELELAPGETRTVAVTIPLGGEPVHPRLVLVGVAAPDFAGWRARLAYTYTSEHGRPWADAQPDGTVPIDVQQGARALEVEGPDGRRWYRPIPVDPEPGHPVPIHFGGRAYEGTLVDLATDEPLQGVRVFARVQDSALGDDHVAQSAVTDEHGRFRLEGLEDRDHDFTFNDQADSTLGLDGESRLAYVWFRPSARPASPPVRLDLRLPVLAEGGEGFVGVRTITVSGTVREAGSQRPVEGAWVSVIGEHPSEAGLLRLLLQRSMGTTDAEGRYSLRVPAAAGYATTISHGTDRQVTRESWSAVHRDGDETRDVDVE